MFTVLGKKIMRHQNRFLALLIVKSIFLLVLFNKLENPSDSPIKVIPTQTWKEVGNVFLKRSLWKENENSDNSEIKGCTTPKVNNMYILNCSDGLSWNFMEHNVHISSLTPGTLASSPMCQQGPSLSVTPHSLGGCSTRGEMSCTST